MARKDFSPVNRAAQSNPIDFTEVVNRHWTAVYKLLHTLAANGHDAEDLAQETFFRALNRLDTFQPGTKMRAWLLRIASNAYFDLHRKRQRANQEPLRDELPATIPQPDHRLESFEQGERVRQAMQQLPETTRLVFHLRAQEELSFREIADVVGTSEEAARWHMHQARTRLLKIVKPELEIDQPRRAGLRQLPEEPGNHHGML